MIGGPLQFSPTKHRCHASVRSRVHLIEGATNRRATQKKRAIIDEDGIYSDTDLVMAQSDSSYCNRTDQIIRAQVQKQAPKRSNFRT
jgi:hypothetical protein